MHKPGHFQVFEDPRHADVQGDRDTIEPEPLSLGTWAGISGAAFSTGMGSGTTLSLSLLTGFFNVRLGYWWDSNIDPDKRLDQVRRTGLKKWALRFTRLFPVPMYLLDEFTARFHGTARQRWYLSDGGHFENMGAYELIRRRVPLIVICDGEQDRNYTLDGLGKLVRKARTDFGAEIEFLDEDQAAHARYVDGGFPDGVGTLEQLRRCYRPQSVAEDIVAEPASCPRRFSRVHAAMAGVRYDGSKEYGSLLLYIKATITGDEPADVIEYSDDHPDFPHQTTVDQFFDEAQWESYRKLGEHIGDKLFG